MENRLKEKLKTNIRELAVTYTTSLMDEDFTNADKALETILSLIDEEKGEACKCECHCKLKICKWRHELGCEHCCPKQIHLTI